MTKKKRRRRIRPVFKVIFAILIIAILALIIKAIFGGTKNPSNNEDAVKVKVDKCIIYYPENGDKELAASLCKSDEKQVIDYTVEKAGDYRIISYPTGEHYYMDDDGLLEVRSFDESGKKILADYLRYEMKKAGRDEYYTRAFLEKTYYENYDMANISYRVEDDVLVCDYHDYDISSRIPLAYVQEYLGMNFGFEKQEYQKPRFLDLNKPMLALTFDDGPYNKLDRILIDCVDKYDSNITFFVVGNRVGKNQYDLIQESINLGNEYGSHGYDHADVNSLSISEAVWSIEVPVNDFKEVFDYDMKLFRPPYGSCDKSIREAIPYKVISWNVDSLDWKYRNFSDTYNEIMTHVNGSDVILMHDLYDSSVEVACAIIPDLIEKGYQFVTVSELIESLGYTGQVFYGQ